MAAVHAPLGRNVDGRWNGIFGFHFDQRKRADVGTDAVSVAFLRIYGK
jgi:hypothetical protein